ncbi:hypothetical protein Tco_0370890 [Tanacetum coccineum]
MQLAIDVVVVVRIQFTVHTKVSVAQIGDSTSRETSAVRANVEMRRIEEIDVMVIRREERSLNNNSFLGEYECSSLALDREERRDEKKRLDHLKQDQTMLVIKRFSERKKVFRERKKTGKFMQRVDYRIVVKEIEDGLLEEMEWFEQDIDGENEDDNENKLVMVNEEGWMSLIMEVRKVKDIEKEDSRDNIGRGRDVLRRRRRVGRSDSSSLSSTISSNR